MVVPDRARNVGVLVVANAALAAAVWGGWRGCAALLAGPLAAAPRALRLAVELLGLGAVIALGFLVFAWIVRAGRYPGGAQLWGLPAAVLRRLRRRRAAAKQ